MGFARSVATEAVKPMPPIDVYLFFRKMLRPYCIFATLKHCHSHLYRGTIKEKEYVKVLILDVKEKLYFGPGGWVNNVQEARDFKRETEALKFALEHGLSNIQILHVFAEPEFDFSTRTMDFGGSRRSRSFS